MSISRTYVDYGDISGDDSESRDARMNAKFIRVSASVTEISDQAFFCSTVKKIIFEEGSQLESIGEQAFAGCYKLKSITIPASVLTISESAFFSSTLARIDFASDSRLETIEKYAFQDCKLLKSIVIPASVISIEYDSFSGSGLVEVAFAGPSKLTVIKSATFRGCKFLKSVTIPASIVAINHQAFSTFDHVELICTDDSNLQVIERDAFEGSKSLTITKLPSKSVRIFSPPSYEDIIFGDSKQNQTTEKNEYFVQLCREGDVSKCEEYLNNNDINLQYKSLDNDGKSKTALDVAISIQNTVLCLLLIKHKAHVDSYRSLYSIYDSLQDENIFQALDNPAQLLQVVCSALSSKKYDVAYNLLQKLKSNLDLGIWIANFGGRTYYDKNILQPILQHDSLKLYQAYVACGFSVNHANLEHFLSTKNMKDIYDQVLNDFTATLVSLDRIALKKCYNLALKYGNVDIIKKTLELLLKVDPSFTANLTKDILFSIPHSKLDSIIPLLVPYITTFGVIKEAGYNEEQCSKYYPETLLSYLAFTKSFIAFKSVIESPATTTPLEPTHFVACSLFRGYYTSKFYKHSTETYDDIFDYLMRDDVRTRVLGSDCEWVDKSIFNCIRYGNEKMAIKLLNLGADLSNIFVHRTCGSDRITMSRFTLLSYACKYQGIALVKELVERGVPVNGTMIDILGEDNIANIDREPIFTMNDEMDIEGGEDDDNDENAEDGEDGDGDDGDEISSEKSFQFFYTSYEIRRTVGNNPWFLPYFCRETMNRNKDIPDYCEGYEFDQQGDLFLLSMTPLGVAIHHEKVEIISFLLERGADPNSTIMDIPTIYNITSTIMGEFCTRYDSCQDTDYEFTHEYGISGNNDILSDSKSNSVSESKTTSKEFDGLRHVLLERNEYCYDENWEAELVCQTHQNQPQDKILASNVDTKHDCNSNDTMENQNITLSNPSYLTFKSTRGKIISLLLQYGLDTLSLVKSKSISIKTDDSDFEFGFDDIRVGFYNDADLLFSIKKCVTSEIMQQYVFRFLEKCSDYLDDDQFFYHLLLLLRYGLAEGDNEETITLCFSRHIAVESVLFIPFIDSGIVSKETLSNELADVMANLVLDYFPAFIKYSKLYPDLFSITFETPKGITLLLGNDIISKYKLLQLGLNINHRTKAGDTLLLHSLKFKMQGSFRVLLSLGADIHLVDQDGKSIEELFMLRRVDCESSTKAVFEKHLHLLTLLVKMNAYQDNLCICGDVKSEDDKGEDKQMGEMIDGEKNKNDNSHNHRFSLSTHAHVLVQSTSVQPSPFTLDECTLIQSSHVPGYTAQTLSYFLSKSIVDDVDTVCVYCNNKFKANDHCRPMLMSVDNSNNAENVENAENTEIVKNAENVEKFIHNLCFHKSNLQDPNIWTKDLKDSICYIVNPTKPLTPRYA